MTYCNSNDIEIQIGTNSLVQLTNDDSSQQTVDNVVVEEALIYSSTLIDGYLRGKYTLPLNTQFPLLRVVAIDICIYRLYSRRIYTDIPETISENYKNAIRTLEQLKKVMKLKPHSVVIGSAITRPQLITKAFVEIIDKYKH